MAWGSAKSNVRSKIASGSFQKKDTTIQDGLMRGAEIIASSWIKEGEEKRAEEKRQKAAAAAEAKRLAAEQRKKEEEAKKRERQAKALAEDLGADPSNKEAIQYFTEQLYLFDDNSATVYNKAKDAVDIGKLSFVQKDDMRPLQGPDVPDSFQVAIPDGMGEMQDRFADGRPLTKGDLAGVAAGEMNDKPTRDAAAQMDEILAPVSQEPEQSVGTYQGIMLDPTAKPKIKLDASRLDTQESIELYLAEINANGQSLDQNQQQIIDDRIKLLADRKAAATDKDQLDTIRGFVDKSDDALKGIVNSPAYTQDEKTSANAILASRTGGDFKIEDYDDVKDMGVLEIARDQAPEDSPKRLQLDALIKARTDALNSEVPELNLDGGFFITTYTIQDEAGNVETIMSTTAPSNKGVYDIENMRLVPQASIVENDSIKTLGEQASLVAQANDKTLKPIREARNTTATMLRSARRLEQFVNPEMGGNPAILTTIGGDVTRIINRLGNEYEALSGFFEKGKDAEAIAYIEQQALQFEETAGMSSQFQAELLKFAYSFAATTLEQRGAGLSNTDFAKALNIVSAGSGYETFSNNLRSQSLQRINTVDTQISDLAEEPQIQLLDKYDPNLAAGFKVPMQDWLGKRDLADMYAWANETAKSTKASSSAPASAAATEPKTVGNKLAELKNSEIYSKVADQLKNVPAENLGRVLEAYSKRFEIPVEVLKQEFGLTQ